MINIIKLELKSTDEIRIIAKLNVIATELILLLYKSTTKEIF